MVVENKVTSSSSSFPACYLRLRCLVTCPPKTSYVKLNREESQSVSVLSWIMDSPRLGSSSVAYPGFIKERLRVIFHIFTYEAHA